MSEVSKEEYIQALKDIQSNDPVVKDNSRAVLVQWHKQFKEKVDSTFGNIDKINSEIRKNNRLIDLIRKKC